MIGIDIGSTQIKAVEVELRNKQPQVVRAVVAPLKTSIISESDVDMEEIAQMLKQVLRESGIKGGETAISLLESQVFTRIIETPALSEKELNQALQWEAERYIPLPLDEVSMDSTIINKYDGKMEVLLVASPTRLIEKYSALYSKAGVRIDAIENEALSILRIYQEQNINSVLLDIGGSTTTVYVLHGEHLSLVRPISMGGNALTKALSTELNLAVAQAEEYKRTYGLDPQQMEGKIADILSQLIEPFVQEVTGSMTFFKERFPQDVISRIILIGGGALLPGLSAFLQNRIQVETVIGNPWLKFPADQAVLSQFKGFESLFSVATGLAIRDVI
ncbi:MAG: Type IV pilus assembly protein PilM [Microgenomates group bacterium GW2011_GWC1_41_8]|uniref:Type IV pilus assembly protein PilM n=1 Tax=Candidatus Roizmanbacteria bacterium GW2011_GWB1_40_7 TaxID=1618482 RepID=A0A0G0VGM3_9BACT|nr:MAG: Type IV pilus assembly protein PilM [Candidatus Levybacteria bacterium GW2011_GWA2_40_16]KKR71200.1 MAG: Type IV pilus assembly protein PilM [Candidatus Roizmanbacteria bacterium GW2011_GWB1_40_7]KKS23851.1 MAG: Type IV pilus assembly protein PilM [Microgenomates group bacterium GW2011_GWC1_41_8]